MVRNGMYLFGPRNSSSFVSLPSLFLLLLKSFRYIWSFVVYRRHIKNLETMTSAQRKEGRLLMQAVFSGIPCFVIITFRHLIHLPLIELIGADWCLLNGPIVYIWFNSEIRSDWLEL